MNGEPAMASLLGLGASSSPTSSYVLIFATLGTLALGALAYRRHAQQQQQLQQAGCYSGSKGGVGGASNTGAGQGDEASDDSGQHRIRVLYGTQTGTAERFAKHVGSELRKHYSQSTAVDVVDLESYSASAQLPRERLVVLCVATYGDGEPTDNAADFFSWLSKEVEAVNAGEKEPFLQNTTFAVFGLGNKQYEHFNAMGKRTFCSLEALGAKPLLARGDGDDDGCIDDDFDKWFSEFSEALKGRADLVGVEQHVSSNEPIEVPSYVVEEFPAGTAEDPPFPPHGTGRDTHSPCWATVADVRELYAPEAGRSCVHVELDMSACAPVSAAPTPASRATSLGAKPAPNSSSTAAAAATENGHANGSAAAASANGNGTAGMNDGSANGGLANGGVHPPSSTTSSSSGGGGEWASGANGLANGGAANGSSSSNEHVYEHGDHVAVWGQNSAAVVEEVAERLGQPLDMVVKLSMPEGSLDRAPPFQGRLSLRTALTLFADVLSTPHKDVLASLSTFASDEEEAKKLCRMAEPEGKAEYSDFIAKPHRSLLEVLRAFPSVKPSLGAFFGCISPRMQPRFYSISSSPKLFPRTVHITASVVKDTMPTGRVHEGIATTFLQNAPKGTRVPAFIRPSHFKLPPSPDTPAIMVGPGTGLAPFRGFLQERAAMRKTGHKLGPAALFFGCRHSCHDYMYREELTKHLANGDISDLHVAFSREGPQKDYVQHHIARHGDRVWSLLAEQQGYLYVCGDAKAMAKDVHKTLVSIVQQHRQCNGAQAETWVKEVLQDTGRYQRDVW